MCSGLRPAADHGELGFPAAPGHPEQPGLLRKLSIYHLTSLKTVAGTALYEIAKRYLTNVGGKTARQHWHWWHDTLTGKPMDP